MTRSGLTRYIAALSLCVAVRAAAQEAPPPKLSPTSPAASADQLAVVPGTPPPLPESAAVTAHAGTGLTLPEPTLASDKEPAPQSSLTPPPLVGSIKSPGGSTSSEPPDLRAPVLPDIGGLPLARLLEKDHIFSGLGTFKQLLPKYGIASYIHGTTIDGLVGQTAAEPEILNDHAGESNPRFGADFNLFVGAELLNRVFVEAQIVFDASANQFGSDYTQLDIRIYRDYLFIRCGKFWTPMGGINVYPDPRYLFPTPELPLFMGTVLPGEWGDLGVQLYGRLTWGEGHGLSYAFYVVNGLEQQVLNPGDPISGGQLRFMTNNYLDQNDPDKGVGAQVVLEAVPGLTLGFSGYEGVYTVTGKHRIYIADAHLGLKLGKFALRGELATTIEETTGDTLLKLGGYALMSYRFKYVEPLLMVDGIRLDGSHDLDRVTATAGIIVYPFPQKVPTLSVRGIYAPRWKTETGEFATHHYALDARVAF